MLADPDADVPRTALIGSMSGPSPIGGPNDRRSVARAYVAGDRIGRLGLHFRIGQTVSSSEQISHRYRSNSAHKPWRRGRSLSRAVKRGQLVESRPGLTWRPAQPFTTAIGSADHRQRPESSPSGRSCAQVLASGGLPVDCSPLWSPGLGLACGNVDGPVDSGSEATPTGRCDLLIILTRLRILVNASGIQLTAVLLDRASSRSQGPALISVLSPQPAQWPNSASMSPLYRAGPG